MEEEKGIEVRLKDKERFSKLSKMMKTGRKERKKQEQKNKKKL